MDFKIEDFKIKLINLIFVQDKISWSLFFSEKM